MFTPDSVSPNRGAVKVIVVAFCRLADISLTQLMVVGCKVINKRSERSARPANSNTSYYTEFRVIAARTHVAYYTRVKSTVKTKAAKRPRIIRDLPSSYTPVVSAVMQYLLFYLRLCPTQTRLTTRISTPFLSPAPHAILIFSLITSHYFFFGLPIPLSPVLHYSCFACCLDHIVIISPIDTSKPSQYIVFFFLGYVRNL